MAFEIVTDTSEVLVVQENRLFPLWILLIGVAVIDSVIYFVADLGGKQHTLYLLLILDSIIILYFLLTLKKVSITFKKTEKTFSYTQKTLITSKVVEGKFSDIVHIFHKKRYDASPFQRERRNTEFYMNGKSRLEMLLENDQILILNYYVHQEYDPWKTQFGLYEEKIGKHIAKIIHKPFINDFAYA